MVIHIPLNQLGKLVDEQFIEQLYSEAILFDSNPIGMTVSASKLKSKGLYISSAKQRAKGRLIISQNRIVVIVNKYKLIDIPNKEEYLRLLNMDKSHSDQLKISIVLDDVSKVFTGIITLSFPINPDTIPLP